MNDADETVLRATLRDWSNFGECLLRDVRPFHFGYGIDVVLNVVRSIDGSIRRGIQESPRLFTIRLWAVEWAEFHGGLSDANRQHPECVNWGLSEVARVSLHTDDSVPVLAVEWEWERRIVIAFNSYELFPPEAER